MGIVTKANLKYAMSLDKKMRDVLDHKIEYLRILSDKIEYLMADTMINETQEGNEKIALLLEKKRSIMKESLGVIGAMGYLYRDTCGENLFSRFVNYKNVDALEGDEKRQTMLDISEILTVADEACREIYSDTRTGNDVTADV